jgi:hypothetical protein
MTMMTGTMVAMDLCISNCWGNMLMSMLLGSIMTVMVIKYMDYKRKIAWVKEKKTYQKLMVDELRFLLKMKGLPTTGIKEDLIKRLIKSNEKENLGKPVTHEDAAQIATRKESMRIKVTQKTHSPSPNRDE